jgi:hypothetical protein
MAPLTIYPPLLACLYMLAEVPVPFVMKGSGFGDLVSWHLRQSETVLVWIPVWLKMESEP